MNKKEFPILQWWKSREEYRSYEAPFTSVPWGLIDAHSLQCLHLHDQTPTILAERGGLDPAEMLAVIHERRFEPMDLVQAFNELGQIIEEWKASHA